MKDDIRCNKDIFFKAATDFVTDMWNDGNIKKGDWCSICLLDGGHRAAGVVSVADNRSEARGMRRHLQKKFEKEANYLGSVSFQL